MKKIDNSIMLDYFQNNDEIKHYDDILEIINIDNPESDIVNVEYFLNAADGIKTEHIKLVTYKSNTLIAYINTKNLCFIDEMCTKIFNEYENYAEVRIAVSDISIIKNQCIIGKFIIKDTQDVDDGVYALLDKEKVVHMKSPDNVEIIYVFDNDSLNALMKTNETLQYLPDEYKKLFKENLLVLMFEDNKLTGYIWAENKYKNYFAIDWIYVYPMYRGKRYGVLLTSSFTQFCIDNAYTPYYGTAISKYSGAVALQSGYEKIYWTRSYTIEKIY